VLVFALASMGASAYAVAIESWPFALVEGVWSVIALRRWFVAPGTTASRGV